MEQSQRQYIPSSLQRHGAEARERWVSKTAAGELIAKHRTVSQAADHLRECDPHFWSMGSRGGHGQCGGVSMAHTYFDRQSTTYAFIFHLPKRSDFPKFLAPVFKSHMFGQALCARCSTPMNAVTFRSLYTDRSFKRNRTEDFVACICGYPVWVLHYKRFLDAEQRMFTYERALHRRRSLSRRVGDIRPRKSERYSPFKGSVAFIAIFDFLPR
jgi:hypothetical protein